MTWVTKLSQLCLFYLFFVQIVFIHEHFRVHPLVWAFYFSLLRPGPRPNPTMLTKRLKPFQFREWEKQFLVRGQQNPEKVRPAGRSQLVIVWLSWGFRLCCCKALAPVMEGLKVSDTNLKVFLHPSKSGDVDGAIHHELSSMIFKYFPLTLSYLFTF